MGENNRTNKEELIEIYNNLLPSLKREIVNMAKIIENTQNILLDECKSKTIELHKLKSN